MNINFIEELGKAIEKTLSKPQNINGIENGEIELAQKLDAIEEYTIDRFEEDMVVIENRKTGKMKNIKKEKISPECKEGDIIKCINGKYFLDVDETEKIEKDIQEKYNDLWE